MKRANILLILFAVALYLHYTRKSKAVKEHLEGDASGNDVAAAVNAARGTVSVDGATFRNVDNVTPSDIEGVDMFGATGNDFTLGVNPNDPAYLNAPAITGTAAANAGAAAPASNTEGRANAAANATDPVVPNATAAAAAGIAASRKPLTVDDLLPKERNPDWFDNPNSDFNISRAISMEVPDFKFGIDTVGQSRKNASLDIRGSPPNPKVSVGPWNNSTIEPDYNIRGFC